MATKKAPLSFEQWLAQMMGGAAPSVQTQAWYEEYARNQSGGGREPWYEDPSKRPTDVDAAGGFAPYEQPPGFKPDVIPGRSGGANVNVDPSVGFRQTPEELWEQTPFASQWLQRLQDMGIAGQGLYGRNPAEAYARQAYEQRGPEFNLQNLAQGAGATPFMQWQPGANRQQRQQEALSNWGSLTGGNDPTGRFGAMQDPTDTQAFDPVSIFKMALASQQGYLAPDIRRFQQNQFTPQYNRWRQQGAATGGGPGFADYLSSQYGL